MKGKGGKKRKQGIISPSAQAAQPQSKKTMASNTPAQGPAVHQSQASQFTNQPVHSPVVYSPSHCVQNIPSMFQSPMYNLQSISSPTYQASGSQLAQIPTSDFQQLVLGKLDSLENRLKKLDQIETQVTSLAQKMTLMDSRIMSLESSHRESDRKLNELEVSRAMDSHICDEIKSKQKALDKDLKGERERISNLTSEYNRIKNENKKITEDILDVQTRSMRDNLLFFGFDECTSAKERKLENCSKTVHEFLSALSSFSK